MANSIQEINNFTQTLKELAAQAKEAKTPLNVLSGTINNAVTSQDVEKINTATKAIQSFYASVEAGKSKSSVNLQGLVNTQGLLDDLKRIQVELNNLQVQSTLKNIGVTPTQASKAVAASNATFTDPGTGKNVSLTQAQVAEFAGIKPAQVRKVLNAVDGLVEAGINATLPELSKTAQTQLDRLGNNKIKDIVNKRQDAANKLREGQLESARLQAEADAKALVEEQNKTRDAVWKGPTKSQPFATNATVKQARRDFEADMESRAQPYVQSNPQFQVTPAQAQAAEKALTQEKERQVAIEQQQQKLLQDHINARAKEQQKLREMGEEALTKYEQQGAKASTTQGESEEANRLRLQKMGEDALNQYDQQGARFSTQQAEKQLKDQIQITKEKERQLAIDKQQATLLQQEIDRKVSDPRTSLSGLAISDLGADPTFKSEYAQQQKQRSDEQLRAVKQQAEQLRLQQAQNNLQDNPMGAIGQAFGGNIQQINALRERLKALKMDTGDAASGFGNLKRISTEASTGVSALSFSMTDASGMTREASMHVDRFGRILQDTSGRFQNFGDLISRNVVKVLEWAVSLTLVYGSIQKISELVTMMGHLQTVMVDIGITTGQTGKFLTDLFDKVKAVADVTASDFGSGIESLAVALRATSGVADQAERSAAAMTLLKDAMSLAKLAGIEHAQAMDYLVASLKQMDMQLTDGSILLDKFQAISQNANTSIEDLAATFSITAGAAGDVGVDVDQLNGLIGAFSEATTLSATETGNALRAMFSNFTQPQGIDTLNKYGIAVKNVDGTFRSFVDVFKEASELSRSGILNERQVADLANALGGGSRRQAQVTALLTVQPRSEELTNISRYDSQGKAQEALKQKTETLESANERLQNSFDNLARTLGGEGAFLTHLTKAVDLLSGLLNIITSLTNALGPSTSTLIGYGIAMAALTKYAPELKMMLGGLGGGSLNGLLGSAKGPLGNLNIPRTIDNGPGVLSTQLTSGQVWSQAGKQIAGAMVPVVLSAISQFNSGNVAEGMGTAIGGTFMAVLSGNPLWAIIGATIGQAAGTLIKQAIDQRSEYDKARDIPTPDLTGKETPAQLSQMRQQATEGFLGLSGFALGRSQTAQRTLVQAGQTVEGVFTGRPRSASEQLMEAVKNYQGDKANFNFGDLAKTYGFSKEEILIGEEKLALLEKITAAEKAYADAKEKSRATSDDPNYQGLQSFQKVNSDYDLQFARDKRFELIKRLNEGTLNKSDYKDKSSDAVITGSSLGASQILIGLNPQLKNATEQGIKPFEEEWKRLKNLLVETTPEDRSFIAETVSQLQQSNEQLDELNKRITNAREYLKNGPKIGIENVGANLTAAADAAILDQLLIKQGLTADEARRFKEELNAALQIAEKTSKVEFKFQGFEDVSNDLNNSDIERIRQKALKLQESYGLQKGIPNNTLTDFANNNPFTLFSKEGTFQEPKDVIRDFWNWAVEEEKRAKQEMDNAWNFQNLRNIEISQKGRLQQAINYYTNLLKKWGFNEKNELITVLFKDNQVGQLVGSQTALQLALQDLTEVTKKQLDGVYNLPSGAQAFIPLSAGQMLSNYTANQAVGSNIDYGNFPTPVIEKGNSILTSIDLGIKRLQQLMAGKDKELLGGLEKLGVVDPTTGLAPGDVFGPVESLQNNKYKPLSTNIAPAAPDSLITTLISQFSKLVSQITSLGPTSDSSLFNNTTNPKVPGLAMPAIKITPSKVEATYHTTTTIRLDGRVLWSAIKQYAFEDYVRFSSSVGSNGRQSNVL